MRRAQVLFSGAPVLLMLLLLSGCFHSRLAPQHCECYSPFVLYLDVPRTVEQLWTAHVTVCRNDDCITSLLYVPDGTTWESGLSLSQPAPDDDAAPGPHVTGGLIPGSAGSELMVVWATAYIADPRDGDTYRVTITEADGAVVLSHSETVAAYDQSPISGDDCAVPVCRTVSIDRRMR